eukprot:9522642-Alexandrium_andersonii.AAC.1
MCIRDSTPPALLHPRARAQGAGSRVLPLAWPPASWASAARDMPRLPKADRLLPLVALTSASMRVRVAAPR